jgi:hypothetical protein
MVHSRVCKLAVATLPGMMFELNFSATGTVREGTRDIRQPSLGTGREEVQ